MAEHNTRWKTSSPFLPLLAAFTLLGANQAFALTLEQARERCREAVGRPIVRPCVQAGGNLEACRERAKPKVRACVERALNAAHGRPNVPVAIPSEATRDAKEKDSSHSDAVQLGFVPPPRTISDIAALLDSEQPDPKRIADLKNKADANPPAGVSREALARFYYDRGNARSQLGRLKDAIIDANQGVEIARGAVEPRSMGRFYQFAGLQYSFAGEPKQALAIFLRQVREMNVPGAKGWLFNGQRHIMAVLIQMGDIAQAETYLHRNLALIQEARTSGLPGWRSGYAIRGQGWEADVEFSRAIVLEARGQFREAEAAFQLAEQRRRASIPGVMDSPDPPPMSQMLHAADLMILGQARMKARQGRFAEAEADARRALLLRLKDSGKYSPTTLRYITGLADTLVEQGRYPEAERLVRIALDTNRTIGVAEDSQSTAQMLSQLGGILNLQGRPGAAATVYAELDKAIAGWETQRRQALELNGSRIYSLYASGRVDAGIVAAQALLKRELSRVGENHFDTAAARGTLAMGYMRANRVADAVREFKLAIPLLTAAARENADDDDTTATAARTQRLKSIIEAYIRLLASQKDGASDHIPSETFQLADVMRGRSVQQALASSSARAVVKDPALADLVRSEQDLAKQINAQLGVLNNVLALPGKERDERNVKAINATIVRLRAEREKARADITRRFPAYSDLIDPKPPSVASIKDTLRGGEALLSFYFGREASFVWAVPKEGPIAFAPIAATAGEIETQVRKLREIVDPHVTMINDIPRYDLSLAHELYNLLLAPVEAGWKSAKKLIVVTNGALGLLPLSLLPTAPADVNDGAVPHFADYRNVPWLARTHAVTSVPSAAALLTLRQLPKGSERRELMIGFGDPVFSRTQLTEAEQEASAPPLQIAELVTRGIALRRRSTPQLDKFDSADLALLPRLPDTAEELRSISLALEVDPAKVLKLGIKANETTVKTADLSRYRIIVFATHGLVPGELNGLTQPALALSAPDVAGVEGDGLLTMEEILALKLNADWVVLSACNTGAGAGAGAEAASGLGWAFFYAGTRAILVTNWSVDSDAARELTTDLFRRQAADATLTRAEALRQSMLSLIDGPGFKDERGRSLFSYAHPLFWAPYTIIGDGG